MATSPSSRTRLLYPSDQSDQNDRESTLFCLDNYEALNNKKKHSTLINKRYIHNKNAGNTYDNADVGGKESSSIFLSLVYGLINAVLTVPCMYGYCAIIFSDEVYLPYRNDLSKLVLLSSAIHQLVFTLLSSLPFAIGQVQDAGLIFLSAMATLIAHAGKREGWDDQEILATILVGTAISTATLGLSLIVIGKFKLGNFVSYLPAPVIGGYLAFIGYFCFIAGLNLCSNIVFSGRIQIDYTAYSTLFQSSSKLLLCIPGILGGIILLVVSHKLKHVGALPLAIVLLAGAFYIVLICSNTSMSEAALNGWVDASSHNSRKSKMEMFYAPFQLFQFHKVKWYALRIIIPQWVAMTFVVAFSSSLDVTAIEMDMGKQLLINHELSMIGVSNFFSGICGGFTGSYIFSQTIFTFRTRTNSRLVGVVVFLSEILLFCLPLSIMEYVPRYFFGATLIFIAFDLMIEWLVFAYKKLLLREYLVLLGTFLAINLMPLINGMGIGVCFAIANFVYAYSSTSKFVVSKHQRTSNFLTHDMDRLRTLQSHREITTLKLHGYIFFGSALAIVNKVKQSIYIQAEDACDMENPQNTINDDYTLNDDVLFSPSFGRSPPPWVQKKSIKRKEVRRGKHRANSDTKKTSTLSNFNYVPLPSHDHQNNNNKNDYLLEKTINNRNSGSGLITLYDLEKKLDAKSASNSSKENQNKTSINAKYLFSNRSVNIKSLPTKILILDFKRVTGIDVTSVRSCFIIIDQICERHDITILCSGCSNDIRYLLQANDLGKWRPQKFANLQNAVRYAEEVVSDQSKNIPKLPSLTMSVDDNTDNIMEKTLRDNKHCGKLFTALFRMGWREQDMTDVIAKQLLAIETWFESTRLYKTGEIIYDTNEKSNAIYIVCTGAVILKDYHVASNQNDTTNNELTIDDDDDSEVIVRQGFIFGESDFFLNQIRTMQASAYKDSTSLWYVTRDKLNELESLGSGEIQFFNKLILRILARQVNASKRFG
jgi:MFS superfamily sulfate permease-like transporter